MVGPAAQREAVAHLQSVLGLSERRACSIVSADRTMIRYRSRRGPDKALRGRLGELANERRSVITCDGRATNLFCSAMHSNLMLFRMSFWLD